MDGEKAADATPPTPSTSTGGPHVSAPRCGSSTEGVGVPALSLAADGEMPRL